MKSICENCKYYLRHYILTKHGYTPTICGHCANENRKSRGRVDNCELYQEIKLDEVKKSDEEVIEVRLKHIQNQLKKLCEYLKLDNKKSQL